MGNNEQSELELTGGQKVWIDDKEYTVAGYVPLSDGNMPVLQDGGIHPNYGYIGDDNQYHRLENVGIDANNPSYEVNGEATAFRDAEYIKNGSVQKDTFKVRSTSQDFYAERMKINETEVKNTIVSVDKLINECDKVRDEVEKYTKEMIKDVSKISGGTAPSTIKIDELIDLLRKFQNDLEESINVTNEFKTDVDKPGIAYDTDTRFQNPYVGSTAELEAWKQAQRDKETKDKIDYSKSIYDGNPCEKDKIKSASEAWKHAQDDKKLKDELEANRNKNKENEKNEEETSPSTEKTTTPSGGGGGGSSNNGYRPSTTDDEEVKVEKNEKEEYSNRNSRLTEIPIEKITESPTAPQIEEIDDFPTEAPTEIPTETPTEIPTETPTEVPTEKPTTIPPVTEVPTEKPTAGPTPTTVINRDTGGGNTGGGGWYRGDTTTTSPTTTPPTEISTQAPKVATEEDVIKQGNTYKLPTSTKISTPTTTNKQSGNSAIPVLAGLAAAAAAGIGAKAYIDKKKNSDNAEEDFQAEDWSNNTDVNIEYQEPTAQQEETLEFDDTGSAIEEPERYGARTHQELEDLQ